MTNIEIKLPDLSSDAVGFLQRVLGPVAEVGDFLSEKIRFHRWKSSVETAAKAAAYARQKGIDPSEIPLRVLVPLLEKASLEEEGSPLLDRWAALLASASADPTAVHTVYAQLLSQISGEDLRILDRLANERFDQRLQEVLAESPDSANISAGLVVSQHGWRNGWVNGFLESVVQYFRENIGDQRDFVFVRKLAYERVDAPPPGMFFEHMTLDVTAYFEEDSGKVFSVSDETIDNAHSISALVSSGLLDRFECAAQKDAASVRVGVVSISPVGLGLVRACRPPKDANIL